MKLKIIKYGGEKQIIDCDSFEFRCNHVANWIEVRKVDGNKELIYNICVIKTLTDESEKEK